MSNENNLNLTEMIREIHDGVAREMYCKGVDDFVCAVKRRFPNDKNGIFHIEEIAEQLKASVENERYWMWRVQMFKL